MALYLPDRAEISSVAQRAYLRNPLPSARSSIRSKIEHPPTDWDERSVLTVPGIVWTVSSDTCATGRLSAPENVGYDHYYREFVFRQPANEVEFGAIMSADSEEVFACYRFDGLSRLTSRSVGAWMEDMEVVLGYVRHVLSTDADVEIVDGLGQYEAYLTSQGSVTTSASSNANSRRGSGRRLRTRLAQLPPRWRQPFLRRNRHARRPVSRTTKGICGCRALAARYFVHDDNPGEQG